MATYDFSVRYYGNAINDGKMPVRELASSLIALSDSFKDIQQIINPNENTVSLEIKATEEGSFIVDLILANGADIVSKTIDMLSGKESTALINLMAYMEVFRGVIELLKPLRKEKVQIKEALPEGYVKLTLTDGTIIETNSNSLKAYQNVEFRNNLKNIVEPLEKDGIDGIEIDSKKTDKIVVEKGDLENFEVPNPEDKELESTVSEDFLQIINVAFEHGKWKFSNGTSQFFANIEDADFIKSVIENKTQFGSTDVLKVKMRTNRKFTRDGLKSEFIIEKVLEHIKDSQQIELNFED